METVIPKYAVWLLNICIISILFIVASVISGFCVGFANGVGGEEIEPTAKGMIFLVIFAAVTVYCVMKRKELFLYRK